MGGRADCCGVGTSFTSTKWLSLNPCGFFGISCSFAVHIFALTTTTAHLISGSFFSQAVFILLYLPLCFMALWSLFMAWTTDPGAVPMGARPLVTVRRAASGDESPSVQARKRGLRRCQKCNDNYKPNRAHHDSVTGRCIVKFDHYCPWVCNAVGAMNHKFFVLFVFYTMNTCITSIIMIVARSVRCGFVYDNSSEDGYDSASGGIADNATTTGESSEVRQEEVGEMDQGRWLETTEYVHEGCAEFHRTYLVVILFCVAVTFLVFTGCMMAEQIEAIQTNQGKIARMKMRVGQGGTELRRVTDEFNEMFGGNTPNVAWHWFVPLPVEFPGSMHKVVLGYEWDPTFDPIPYREDNSSGGGSTGAASSTDGMSLEDSVDAPPSDIETGLPQDDLDEVPLDGSTTSHAASAILKKRSVSSGGLESSLPELT